MAQLRFEDVAGALALFALLIGGFWLAAGLDLSVGAGQLMEVVP